MLREWVAPQSTNEINLENSVTKENILRLAQKSHENYLLRSQQVDLENAIDFYIRVMKMDPNISEPYYKLASLLWEKGQIDIDAALRQCKRGIRKEPKSQKARLYYGYFLKTAGKYKEAEEQFETAIQLNKFLSSKARLALAISIIEKMQVEKIEFQDFVKGFYFMFSGIVTLSWDYNSLRMLFKSLMSDVSIFAYKLKGMFFSSARKYDLAIENYERAAKDTGKHELFYTKAGDISLSSGNSGIAVKSYKKALEHNPNNCNLWVKLANTLQNHHEDELEELADCYNNLLKHDPQNARIYYELGHLYTKLNEKLYAVNAFKKAIELDPENPFFRNSLAYALIQVRHYDEALIEYKKAIKMNPDSKWTSVVCQAQGAIYHQIKGNHEAAITSYETAAILDKENGDAYFALGEIYHEMEELDNAIDNYCLSLKIRPDDAKTYCCLGMALWEKDCLDECIVAFEKCICIDPENINAYNNLGVVYLDGTGDVERSIKAFKDAIRVNPSFVMAYFNIGRAYQIIGDKTSAAESYQMALNLNKIKEEMDHSEIEERIYNLFNV